MTPRRSLPAFSNRRPAGFSLTEVLVALSITSIVVLAVGSAFVFVVRGWTDSDARLAAQQNLRTGVEEFYREVRLTGTCLLPSATTPPANFKPLDGSYSGVAGTDTLTVQSNTKCAVATLVALNPCNACATISLDNVDNFSAGMYAYIYQANSLPPRGEPFVVLSVNAAAKTLAVTPKPPAPYTITQNYSADSTNGYSSVYGLEQRMYQITTIGGVPTLTLTTLNTAATPIAKGIEKLAITYTLNRVYNAGTCDAQTGGSPPLCVVNLPGSAADWQLVRSVTVVLGARSTGRVRGAGGDGYLHLSEIFQITPRNFVFMITRL